MERGNALGTDGKVRGSGVGELDGMQQVAKIE